MKKKERQSVSGKEEFKKRMPVETMIFKWQCFTFDLKIKFVIFHSKHCPQDFKYFENILK